MINVQFRMKNSVGNWNNKLIGYISDVFVNNFQSIFWEIHIQSHHNNSHTGQDGWARIYAERKSLCRVLLSRIFKRSICYKSTRKRLHRSGKYIVSFIITCLLYPFVDLLDVWRCTVSRKGADYGKTWIVTV